MRSYETTETAETMILREADVTCTPVMGVIELLPLCNMNCRMCYVHLSKAEMDAQGRMLTCEEWLSIVKAACEEGLLFLTLTGGEVLLYPELKRLYTEISQMGVVLEVKTNGTLLDEELADFFSENGVQRIYITLYGKDNATYAALCGNADGFTQVMRAAGLLKEREIPFVFDCSLTPDNIDQLPELYQIAEAFDVPLSVATYMFPGLRRGITSQEQYRLAAEQAAEAEVSGCQPVTSPQTARETLAKLKNGPKLKGRTGFPCRAGRSVFNMNWRGELLPCGMFLEPRISLLEHSFRECWDFMVDACQKTPQCQDCIACDLQNLCQVCPAVCMTETGSTAGRPEYICRMTEHKVRELRKIAVKE
ncbi:MAG: radical SAM protein [Clostridiales bacterium]|nr:radical SAM protein [Clostridiales bacterium]